MEIILKRTKGHNRIRLGYAVAFFLLLVAYAITFYANQRLINQSHLVEHSNKVIANLEILLSSLKDAETGIRGYVITRNPDFLSPYTGAREKTQSLYYEVLQLTADTREQQEQLKSLKKNIDKRFTLFYSTLEVYNGNNSEISDSLVQIQVESKKVMEEIRSQVATMQTMQSQLLKVRDENLQTSFTSIRTITIISLLLAFVFIIFGFLTYIKENRARKAGVNEIVEYQEELKNRIKELHEANEELVRMKSQEKFAATGRIARTIAHEVRNPLTNINLAVDQLKSEVVTTQDETSVMLFDMIKRNSTRINQLISELLNSTKFTELTYQSTSVNELLNEALKEAQDRIALTNVEVIKKYSADMCDVSVDKGKIKLAFLNIIINALEEMENKEGSVLTLETKGEKGKCKVIIRDNGSGLDEESASRLFEPYFTSKPKGNGLGLTNTQNIILNHKGEISVETSKGKGTSFTIVLDFPD